MDPQKATSKKRRRRAFPAAVCVAVEEMREGFRMLSIRAAENGDKIGRITADLHHRIADKLVVEMGGDSVILAEDSKKSDND